MKRTFTGCPLVLAALSLTLGIHAQQTITTQPAQSMAAPQADFSFANAIADKAAIGPHVVRGAVQYTGPVVLADSGEVIFEGVWFDNAAVGKAGPVKEIDTSSGRVVIAEGADLGGTSILQLINNQPGQLQRNSFGQVAYLAIIQGNGCPIASCIGLLVEKQLIAVSTAGETRYLLTDTGQIQAPADAQWLVPVKGGIKVGKAGGKFPRWIGEIFPTISIPGQPIPLPGRPPIVVTPPTVSGRNLPGSQPAQVVQATQMQPAKFPPTPFPLPCHIPMGFGNPLPSLWPAFADAAGPIGSSQPDGPFSGAIYKSALHPGVGVWTRRAFYAHDCRVVMTAMGILGGGTQELFSPSGLIGYFDAGEGGWKFAGASALALSPSNAPMEDGISINRACRVLIPVMFKRPWGEEPNLILGTPTKPGRCSAQ